jgi:MFS family permease
MLAGLGIAGMAPTTLSLVGAAFPTSTGAATGAALAIGYLAFVLGPATAGAVATAVSLQAVVAGIAVAGGATALLATRLPRIPGDTSEERRPALALVPVAVGDA